MTFTKTKDPVKRFFEYVLEDDRTGCWLWQGGRMSPGKKGLRAPYGKFWFEGRTIVAHKFIYEEFVGPVPAGLQLDHECEIHYCVNPDHLTPKTPGENTLASAHTIAAINKAKKRCKRGHRFTLKNTRVNNVGRRICRRCDRDRMRSLRAQ